MWHVVAIKGGEKAIGQRSEVFKLCELLTDTTIIFFARGAGRTLSFLWLMFFFVQGLFWLNHFLNDGFPAEEFHCIFQQFV